MLEFNIKNQTISRVDRFNPATDSVDYLTAKFNFITTDWDGVTKKALFRSGTVSYEAAISTSGVCKVPFEVLISPDNKFSVLSGGCIKIFVSVVGTSGTMTIPTKECRVEIGASGLNETLNGATPTPNIYEQFVDTIKADNDTTVAEIKADNDETRGEVEALAERAEAAKTSAEQSAASMKNDYANALKGTASGEVVRVDDVSPIEHTAKVKIIGDIDPSTVTITRCGVNLLPKEYITKQTDTIITTGATHDTLDFNKDVLLPKGTYTFSTNYPVEDTNIRLFDKDGNNKGTVRLYNLATETFTLTEPLYVHIYAVIPSAPTLESVMWQIESGVISTDYEAYNGATYTPAADGSCDIVSVSPTMTLLTDTEGVTVECEYNRDINKVIADLYNKING